MYGLCAPHGLCLGVDLLQDRISFVECPITLKNRKCGIILTFQIETSLSIIKLTNFNHGGWHCKKNSMLHWYEFANFAYAWWLHTVEITPKIKLTQVTVHSPFIIESDSREYNKEKVKNKQKYQEWLNQKHTNTIN